jgi:hypothetical protein
MPTIQVLGLAEIPEPINISDVSHDRWCASVRACTAAPNWKPSRQYETTQPCYRMNVQVKIDEKPLPPVRGDQSSSLEDH